MSNLFQFINITLFWVFIVKVNSVETDLKLSDDAIHEAVTDNTTTTRTGLDKAKKEAISIDPKTDELIPEIASIVTPLAEDLLLDSKKIPEKIEKSSDPTILVKTSEKTDKPEDERFAVSTSEGSKELEKLEDPTEVARKIRERDHFRLILNTTTVKEIEVSPSITSTEAVTVSHDIFVTLKDSTKSEITKLLLDKDTKKSDEDVKTITKTTKAVEVSLEYFDSTENSTTDTKRTDTKIEKADELGNVTLEESISEENETLVGRLPVTKKNTDIIEITTLPSTANETFVEYVPLEEASPTYFYSILKSTSVPLTKEIEKSSKSDKGMNTTESLYVEYHSYLVPEYMNSSHKDVETSKEVIDFKNVALTKTTEQTVESEDEEPRYGIFDDDTLIRLETYPAISPHTERAITKPESVKHPILKNEFTTVSSRKETTRKKNDKSENGKISVNVIICLILLLLFVAVCIAYYVYRRCIKQGFYSVNDIEESVEMDKEANSRIK